MTSPDTMNKFVHTELRIVSKYLKILLSTATNCSKSYFSYLSTFCLVHAPCGSASTRSRSSHFWFSGCGNCSDEESSISVVWCSTNQRRYAQFQDARCYVARRFKHVNEPWNLDNMIAGHSFIASGTERLKLIKYTLSTHSVTSLSWPFLVPYWWNTQGFILPNTGSRKIIIIKT